MEKEAEGGCKRFFAALGLSLAALFPIACADLTAIEGDGARLEKAQDSEEGAVSLIVVLGRVSPLQKSTAALAKMADTLVTLKTLHLQLTSPGCPAREMTLPVAGDINSASGSVAALVSGLPSLRNWKIKAWTKDAADSVMHIDSTTFFVRPGDTSAVSMRLMPAYSVLVARFFSNDKKATGIKKLELVVGGVVVDDTTFSSLLKEFDVKLSHKYLRTGASTTVELRAYNNAKSVRYFRAITLNPGASMDSEVTVELSQDGN